MFTSTSQKLCAMQNTNLYLHLDPQKTIWISNNIIKGLRD
jgi:hypothetical protein